MTRRPGPPGYTTREVALLFDLSEGQVRSYVRAGFLRPRRGRRREYRFSFQDLVLLRTAKGLLAARIPRRRVLAALDKLRRQLPRGRSLSGMRISAAGSQVVVRDGSEVWDPESGQKLLDFEVAELVAEAAPMARRIAADVRRREAELAADDWFQLGCELEAALPEEAESAYRRALELDPRHADANLNLGRLLHERGEVAAAERHYRQALTTSPGDATAAFDLGVALEDQGRLEEAEAAYRAAIEAEPGYADAHYNLSGVCERLGQRAEALRHLKSYKFLIQQRG